MHGNAAASGGGWMPRDLRRWTLAGIGVLATSLAVIGVILPGLPATVFVIVAAWCFARSCPVLEQKLLRNRILGPSMEIVDGSRPLTPATRAAAIGVMSAGGGVSIGALAWADRLQPTLLGLILLGLLIGGIAIAMYRPRPRPQARQGARQGE